VIVGNNGNEAGVTLIVSEGPFPHELVPNTIILPTPVPAVAVIEPVVLVPDHPVPLTFQLKDVAPVEVAV
jgi:hypothetical protein